MFADLLQACFAAHGTHRCLCSLCFIIFIYRTCAGCALKNYLMLNDAVHRITNPLAPNSRLHDVARFADGRDDVLTEPFSIVLRRSRLEQLEQP